MKIYLFFICLSIYGENYKKKLVMSGLGIPWAIEFVSKKEAIATDRNGFFNIINLEKKTRKQVKFPLKLFKSGQGGLLDLKKSPEFDLDRTLFFTYSKPSSLGATTALGKFKYENGKITDVVELFSAKAHSSTSRHFGSRLSFDELGNLFMSVGDRGVRELAQNKQFHNGKILRLNQLGKPARGNPFEKEKNSLNEIWSLGHRNPQGLFYELNTKTLWEGEHGPRGGDEINKIKRGYNYGWPIVSRGKEYVSRKRVGVLSKKGFIGPLKTYIPSIAPSGLIVYSGKKIEELKGAIIQGALGLKHLNVFSSKGEQRLFKSGNERVRAVKEDSAGNLYFSSDSGHIYIVN